MYPKIELNYNKALQRTRKDRAAELRRSVHQNMISRSTKILIVLALLPLGLGVALDRYMAHRFYSINTCPVRKRIEVTDGFELTQTFTVDYASDYEVGIRCKRALSEDRLDGILESKLNLTYSVFEDNVLLVRVDSTDSPDSMAYDEDAITRLLGDFPASPGKEYRIEILVRSSIPELASTDPVLLVVIDAITWTHLYFHQATPFALGRLASVGIGLLFLFCACVSQVIHWTRRRRSIKPTV